MLSQTEMRQITVALQYMGDMYQSVQVREALSLLEAFTEPPELEDQKCEGLSNDKVTGRKNTANHRVCG
jgi:hypothetical protein